VKFLVDASNLCLLLVPNLFIYKDLAGDECTTGHATLKNPDEVEGAQLDVVWDLNTYIFVVDRVKS